LRGGAGSVGWREEEEERKGGGEADRRGPGVSVAGGKRREEEVGRRGEARRAAGPSGLKGKSAMFCFFSFFFLFNFIFKPFFISNSIQTFSNFFSRIL
jgi:hypothetical protein